VARVTDARRAELADNLARVRERIDAACAAAGRSPAEIVLVGVTKTFPASDVALLAELGVRDIGENRDQEAAPKAARLAQDAALRPSIGLVRWHFIGALQTNKCRSVSRYASVVHSVDRPRLVAALATAASERAVPLDCLVQVDLDDGAVAGRAGAPLATVAPLADAVAAAPGLRLAGVMAVAPLRADPWRAFARLADVAADVRADHPEASAISAGMSGDLEAAIANGATLLRVGAALLGSRAVAR
jgi:pyridoxal phosphate enzyme (YggS family)